MLENKPLNANQNVKWFKLGGASKDAILRALDLNDENKIKNTEIDDLRGILGLKFIVARTDVFHGFSAHAPEIFASPYPNENEFYMMCPIGGGRKDGKEYFIPKDSIELNDDEIKKLSRGLFSPYGTSEPVLHVPPIALNENAGLKNE